MVLQVAVDQSGNSSVPRIHTPEQPVVDLRVRLANLPVVGQEHHYHT